MASIHDQWPEAISEWDTVAANFNAAWVTAFTVYNVSPQFAAVVACICYLSRMHEDTAVMAGDMITHLAQTGQDSTRGLVQNFQHLDRTVLPAWGALAADYAETRAQAWAAHEAANRVAADQAEATARAAGDDHTRQQTAAAIALEPTARAFADDQLRTLINAGLTEEANARAAGDDHTRQQMAAAISALSDQLTKQINSVLQYAQSIPGLVDTRAANGYDPTLRARGSVFQKLLDTVVAHDPAVASLVSNLAKFIIGLAGIEDPILRIAAQLVLKQVIDRLGLDSALHAMLGDLIGSVLGGGQPKTLQDIMGDIGDRLDALESSTAALSPLAPEADQLHEMGTLIFDAALLGYLAAAVAAPKATADDTVAVFAPVTGPLFAPVRALLGMP